MNPERFDEGRFDYGEAVRVTRNIRNDGTYPNKAVGDLLVRRGSVGHVVDVGTFLQDQVIFTVHFLDIGIMVGCRLEELIGVDEPWYPSRFEFRDKVRCNRDLAIQGEVLFAKGTAGEILKVLRSENGIQYHVYFPDRTVQVPESVLEPLQSERIIKPENE